MWALCELQTDYKSFCAKQVADQYSRLYRINNQRGFGIQSWETKPLECAHYTPDC